MGKEISSRWKNTSQKDRERFEALAKVDAERYKKEVQIYEEEQVLKAREEREKSLVYNKSSSSNKRERNQPPQRKQLLVSNPQRRDWH